MGEKEKNNRPLDGVRVDGGEGRGGEGRTRQKGGTRWVVINGEAI